MERVLQPERMDDPALNEALHRQALQGLERINRFSRSAEMLWPPLQQLFRDLNVRMLRALDIATGAGDVPIQLWHRARQAGLALQIEGCDRSERAVEHARDRAAQFAASVRFFTHDPLTSGVPQGYDVLLCSLFLHHLPRAQAKKLLEQMGQAAGRMVAVNDLVRSPAGWIAAFIGTRLLTRSPVVHTDGLLSVQAAYTTTEIKTLAEEAGLRGVAVRNRWPFRFLLVWRK